MKRILSWILSMCLILILLPQTATAASNAAVRQPYAISRETFYRTYMALGDSVDISFMYGANGYNAFVFPTYLSGKETQEQLTTKAQDLLRYGAKGILVAGGWRYSMPVEYAVTETIKADDFGVGTYLFVCAAFDYDLNYYYDTVFAIALHIVKDPVPLTDIEYYWCDQYGGNLQEIQPGSTSSIGLHNDSRYLYVKMLPENATCRLERIGGVFNDKDVNAALLVTSAEGNNIYSLSARLCGEGYIRAVIDAGNPDEPVYNKAFNVTVACEPKDDPVVTREATCTENGKISYTCENYWHCGTIFSSEDIPATGHDWRWWHVTSEPTKEETGEIVYRCWKCGEERYEVVPTIDTPPEKPYKIKNVVSGVHVYWNDVNGARKYGVWRSETGKEGTYKWLGNPTVNHFTDTGVESGKTYYYKITVLHTRTNTHSQKSEALGITYVSTPDISARYNKAAGVKLEWQKITGATGYAIYRKSYSGNDAWVRVATISGNSTLTWTDASVKNENGTAYKYTIRALAGAGMKTLSGCRTAGRSMVRLASRTLNSAAAVGENAIKCAWTTSAAVTGYEVRFMVDGEVYKTFTVGSYKTGIKTFTGLEAGHTYKIQVRSYRKIDGMGFYSAWSEPKYVTLLSYELEE